MSTHGRRFQLLAVATFTVTMFLSVALLCWVELLSE
jgi:hypothetical protein